MGAFIYLLKPHSCFVRDTINGGETEAHGGALISPKPPSGRLTTSTAAGPLALPAPSPVQKARAAAEQGPSGVPLPGLSPGHTCFCSKGHTCPSLLSIDQVCSFSHMTRGSKETDKTRITRSVLAWLPHVLANLCRAGVCRPPWGRAQQSC